MKVSVRLLGDGLASAQPLAQDMRRRAIEHLEARLAARRDKQQSIPARSDPAAATPNTR